MPKKKAAKAAPSRRPKGKPRSKAAPAKAVGAEKPEVDGKVFHTGLSGFDQEEAEAKQAAQLRAQGVGNVRRFWLQGGEKGLQKQEMSDELKSECGIVCLDDVSELDEFGFGFHEHNVQIDGRWHNYSVCRRETGEGCGLCAENDKSYFTNVSSWFAIRPWKSAKSEKDYPGSRELLCLKRKTRGKIMEILQYHIDKYGTTRGCYIYMRRDCSEKNSASIGEPVILDGGIAFDHYTEEDLENEFGHDEIVGESGDVLAAKNQSITPMPYSKMFKVPTAKDMADRFRLKAPVEPVGSASSIEKEWEDSAAPAASTEKRAPRRKPPAPSAKRAEETEEVEDTEETEETELNLDDATYTELGEILDSVDNDDIEKILRKAAEELELDPDDGADFPTWQKLGEKLDEHVEYVEEEADEEEAESEADDADDEGDPLEGEE